MSPITSVVGSNPQEIAAASAARWEHTLPNINPVVARASGLAGLIQGRIGQRSATSWPAVRRESAGSPPEASGKSPSRPPQGTAGSYRRNFNRGGHSHG